MAKESLKDPGYSKCGRICLVVMMVVWSLLGFVAGLVVGTIAIRNGYWREIGGGGVSGSPGVAT